jgi:cyclopropane-fatty-acyl-phospholipid synthase
MIEHVGYRNYETYFRVVNRCLKDDGLFLLHSIGNTFSVKNCDLWTKKYIFPVGMVPSVAQLGKAWENQFVMQDWHNFGVYYDQTLMAWYDNFVKNWGNIKDHYSERFFRMWKFYLLSAAGNFRSGNLCQLWQIVLSKNGMPKGYQSIR